ncbi:MAG: PIN domain-containing protein [Chthoniobacterales bacterium]|nr:PIN domain-containing protein [Chthoniobacterales bacterium]
MRPESRKQLSSFFDLLAPVPIDHLIWQAVENLAWQLDRSGRVLPLLDLVIAVCALHAGAAVLTNDKHFTLIPQLELASW